MLKTILHETVKRENTESEQPKIYSLETDWILVILNGDIEETFNMKVQSTNSHWNLPLKTYVILHTVT